MTPIELDLVTQLVTNPLWRLESGIRLVSPSPGWSGWYHIHDQREPEVSPPIAVPDLCDAGTRGVLLETLRKYIPHAFCHPGASEGKAITSWTCFRWFDQDILGCDLADGATEGEAIVRALLRCFKQEQK